MASRNQPVTATAQGAATPTAEPSAGDQLLARCLQRLDHDEGLNRSSLRLHLQEYFRNARITAAAPELYVACRAIDHWQLVILSAVNFDQRDSLEGVSAAFKLIRAALAKAEGRS